MSSPFGAGESGAPNANWAGAYPRSAKALDDIEALRRWLDKNFPGWKTGNLDEVQTALSLLEFCLDVLKDVAALTDKIGAKVAEVQKD